MSRSPPTHPIRHAPARARQLAARRLDNRTSRIENLKSPCRPPGRGAFTLLEVVLALTLTLVLAGAAYAFYRQALEMRRSVHLQSDSVLAQRRILDMIAEDLRSAVAYSTLQTGLNGEVESVSFPRTTVPSGAVFAERRFTEARPSLGQDPAAGDVREPEHDVQLVGYRLRREEDEEGVEQIVGIVRTCQRNVTAETAEEGSDIEAVLLSGHVKFLYLQYWDGEQWVETWPGPSAPPAVRVAVGLETLEEGLTHAEYPHETLWRVVAVPTGWASGQSRSSRQEDQP